MQRVGGVVNDGGQPQLVLLSFANYKGIKADARMKSCYLVILSKQDLKTLQKEFLHPLWWASSFYRFKRPTVSRCFLN